MQAIYGSYAFPANECWVTRSKRPNKRDDLGRVLTEIWTVVISGVRHGTDQTDITNQMLALEAAFSVGGQNFFLKQDDGSNSHVQLLTTGTVQNVGVQVVLVDFPVGDGAEYSTYRSYTIQLEAEYYRTGSGQNELLEFEETFRTEGGGEDWVFFTCPEGPPVRQTRAQSTPYRMYQEGHAVGLTSFPEISPPVAPGQIHDPETRIIRTANALAQRWTVAWSYSFEDSSAFNQ